MALNEIVRSDEVDEKLAALASQLAEAGREAGEEVLRKRAGAGKAIRRIETPKYAEEFLAGARAALEDEVVRG